MNYKIEHIIKACELSELTKEQIDIFCKNLDEAVKLLTEIKDESLRYYFDKFCLMNNVSEEDIKSKCRKTELVNLRKKFAILAKEHFPNHNYRDIGWEINRNSTTVVHYFKMEKARKEKRDNLERMKNRV